MSPPHDSPEAELFAQALGLPADERDPFLDRACDGKAELRRKIDILLQAHAAIGSFMEASPVAHAVRAIAAAELPAAQSGQRIGRYKLLQKIGEGGCGIVYMAEQEEPVRRRVALKLIKLGMDTREVIARFEGERQALALMDHPHIARVFDGGATDSGRPYFVMELVRGVPITKFCDEQNLSAHVRLQMFVQVCHAVQHAHQKGIIHRDLKPSNILVTLHDGIPVPKVIDFGIAKATQGRLTDATLFTAFEQFIGTPAYMSPEQAEMSGLDIDTRSDIYSLGVLLYELLTGNPPFDPKSLVSAGLDEIRRIIREVDPPRPSTRLSTLSDLDRATIAKQRAIAPAQLTTLLRGDLDWIVMRCLEKDRTRRYETASGLALDISRHLRDETVTARPPSAAYRLQKLIRRNRLVVGAATAVFGALTFGLVASVWQGVRANAEARRAEAQAERANLAEQAAKNEAAVARAVSEFLQKDVLSQAGGWRQADQGLSPNPNLTVREALDRAAKRLESRFSELPLVEAAIRQTIGNAYVELGDNRVATTHYERALELRQRVFGLDHVLTLGSMADLANGFLNSGRFEEAITFGEEVMRRSRTALPVDDPERLRGLFVLAGAYRDRNRWGDALPLLEEVANRRRATLGADHAETLRASTRVAEAYSALGRQREAIELSDQTVGRARAVLGDNHPVTLTAQGHQARIYRTEGRTQEALSILEEALERTKEALGPDHVDVRNRMHQLADIYRDTGRVIDALPLYREALRITKLKLGDDHPYIYAELFCMAGAYRAMKDFASEEEALRDLLARRNSLGSAEGFPALTWLASNLNVRRKFAEAEMALREDLSVRETKTPDDWRTVVVRILLGEALTRQKNFSAAEPLLVEGYAELRKRESTMQGAQRTWLRAAVQRLITLYTAWGKPDKAAEWNTALKAHPPVQATNAATGVEPAPK